MGGRTYAWRSFTLVFITQVQSLSNTNYRTTIINCSVAIGNQGLPRVAQLLKLCAALGSRAASCGTALGTLHVQHLDQELTRVAQLLEFCAALGIKGWLVCRSSWNFVQQLESRAASCATALRTFVQHMRRFYAVLPLLLLFRSWLRVLKHGAFMGYVDFRSFLGIRKLKWIRWWINEIDRNV